MPHTLAHIGLQYPLGKTVHPAGDPRWIALGLMIPDFSWILQRGVLATVPAVPAIELRGYAVIQSTPFMCLILALAFAALSRKPRVVFGVLMGHAMLHLGTDAVESRGGVGVSFLAPFDWSAWSFPLLAMDGVAVTLFGVAGMGVLIWLTLKRESWVKPILAERMTSLRCLVAVAGVAAWLFLPLVFVPGAIRNNVHDLATWSMETPASGTKVHLDRVPWTPGDPGTIKNAIIARPVPVHGVQAHAPALLSATATFMEDRILSVDNYILHPPGRRVSYTYLGLAGVLWIWMIPLLSKNERFKNPAKQGSP
jgi:hypothetical protein